MKAKFASLAFFVAGVLAQSKLTLNTPAAVVECQPLQLSWSGGTAPYYISVHNGNDPNGAALENFPEQNGTSYTWDVNYASNTYLDLTIVDSQGDESQTAPFSVQPGSTTSCLTASSGAPAPASSATGSSTGSTSTPTSSAGTTAASTTSSAPATTSSTSAASANVAQLGVVGVAGAAVAALFL